MPMPALRPPALPSQKRRPESTARRSICLSAPVHAVMTAGFTVSVDFTGIVENEPEEVSEYTYGAPEFVPGPVLPEVVEPPVSRVQAPSVDPVSARSKIVNRSAMLSSRVGLDQPIGSGVHRRGRDRNHKSCRCPAIAVIISDGVRDGGRASRLSACRISTREEVLNESPAGNGDAV